MLLAFASTLGEKMALEFKQYEELKGEKILLHPIINNELIGGINFKYDIEHLDDWITSCKLLLVDLENMIKLTLERDKILFRVKKDY